MAPIFFGAFFLGTEITVPAFAGMTCTEGTDILVWKSRRTDKVFVWKSRDFLI